MKRYWSNRNLKLGDTLLWRGKRWRVLFAYPPQNWFDERTAYCLEAL
jgi:hypothetical protein